MGLRKHCNPLTFRDEVEKPDWSEVFAVKRPLEIDIGCGKGDFIFERAENNPDINVIGIDVREAFFEILKKRRSDYEKDNIFVLRANINFSITELFKPETISKIHIYFPDPWFKKRHQKRRIVTPELIDNCLSILVTGGELHLATDVEPLAAEMLEICAEKPTIKNLAASGNYYDGRIFTETTNWEKHLIKAGKPIWRTAFKKN